MTDFEIEEDVLSAAVVSILHVLIEIAQDQDKPNDDRMWACDTVLGYAESLFAITNHMEIMHGVSPDGPVDEEE